MSYANGYAPITDKKCGYFIGGEHRHKYSYDAIGHKVQGTPVEGKHIFVQLEFLKLSDVFAEGDTPCGLPYSFSSCAPHA